MCKTYFFQKITFYEAASCKITRWNLPLNFEFFLCKISKWQHSKFKWQRKNFLFHFCGKMSISAIYFLSQIYVTKINIQHRNLHICKNFFLQKWNTKSHFQTRVNLQNKNCFASLCQLSQNKYHKIFSRFSEC